MVSFWSGEEEAQHALQQDPGGGGVQHTHWIHITLLTEHHNKLHELVNYLRKKSYNKWGHDQFKALKQDTGCFTCYKIARSIAL